MTFERENRVGHHGGWLWGMSIDNAENRGYGRRLILEPLSSQHPLRAAELQVWVEERKSRYHWIVESPDERPSGPPTWTTDVIEIKGSRQTLLPQHALEWILIKALACGDLHGESAASAVHSLFWLHFVDDDNGLAYLGKHASKEQGNFYARERLLRYVRYHDRDGSYTAQSAIEDAMKHNRTLGERFACRVNQDRALRDAIEVLLLTNEPEEMQQTNVRKLVELNATRMDHVIAGIVDATRDNQPLLGLRACQRAERDTEFFATVDAFVQAHPEGILHGMIKFLRPHCKPPKAAKPAREEENDCYE